MRIGGRRKGAGRIGPALGDRFRLAAEAAGAAVATTGGGESGAAGVPGRFLITRKRTTPSVIRRSCESVSISVGGALNWSR